jgi:hypothetical protein
MRGSSNLDIPSLEWRPLIGRVFKLEEKEIRIFGAD